MASTLATFKRSIDVANSPHRAAYEKRMAAMETETASRFRIGPETVVARLIHALESPSPKARYRISPHTHAILLARRLLPMPVIDALMARS